jgi:dihydrodipicolinate synthase/N-acetylneuraminate lyase
MKKEKKVCGVVVPMITPFDGQGRIDTKAVEAIIDSLVKAEVAPFIIGTTGEASSIVMSEKREFVKIALNAAGHKAKVYAGISSNCFNESVDMAKEFFDLGIYAAVANLPSYYSLTEYQMLSYFEHLAEAVPGPLVIYNIQATTHMSIPLEVVEKLSHHPNIYGLKDSEKSIPRQQQAAEMFKDREDFSHLLGWAAYSAQCMLNGSDGFVPSTGNFVPKMFKDLYDAGLRNDAERAFKLQKETDEIAAVYQKDKTLGQSLAALKTMMNEINLCLTTMLPPLTTLQPDEEATVRENTRAMINKYGIQNESD